MSPPVHVRGLTKSYGAFEAVKGVDFDIHAGEVFGLLGPNGAGKTTTVEILEGLRPLVQELRREQRTILLTTHYIEEAEKLCDRVAIIDEGRIVAMGTPEEIRARTVGHARVEVTCEPALPPGDPPRWPDAEPAQISLDRRTIAVSTPRPARTLVDLVRWIDQLGVELSDVQLKRPSLEDVFIELTGKSLRE
jgi:ABC-2 type transport system ATP-binding protein